ncbi:MAG TPA: pyrroline-5-carboxylate reductase [Candidatus Omnitrophota bacterium]|nr:pyrroline-5-carboxylate reductase [Candidatus Omnitrophota bacterium]HPB67486.1 pyrroline-5-carboxylate reductase [Candidatus Omnitrophota bacterium]HQO57124.1 pyrroline-5-carboxylate reductase [Candidatus Omnitrophota bacterium]
MKQRVGFIGGGNMGTAIISRISRHYAVAVCEKDPAKAKTLKRKYHVGNKALPVLVEESDIIILAVKPQDCASVFPDMAGVWAKDKLLISIAAGLTTRFLEEGLPSGARVVRTMPNMPAVIAEGMTALCRGRHARAGDIRTARKIFEYVGATAEVEEQWMDAVTAVSGSGPAYVFLFAECLMTAAASLGMDKKLSRQLVCQTLQGSVHLLLASQEEAAGLRARVTSKGGTTQAAMDVFDKYNIQTIFTRALEAAERRSKQLRS